MKKGVRIRPYSTMTNFELNVQKKFVYLAHELLFVLLE